MIRQQSWPLVLFLAGIFSTPVLSQTPMYPDGVGARFLFLDHYTPNIADIAESQQISNGIELSYYRNLGLKYLNAVIPVKLAVAKFPNQTTDVRFASADLLIQGVLFDPDKAISPYIFAGGGYVMENYKESNIQFPMGLGTHIRLTRDFYLNFQAEYRVSMAEGKDNLQYGLGFMYVPGLRKKELPKDTDGDGILDTEDLCPTVPGTIPCKGCPDQDSDGIADHMDECPEIAGSIATKGCPDTDNDGIADKDDACPEVFGLATLKGCPDLDGDGIPDKDDKCPEIVGAADMEGCPDSDHDGIIDLLDKCPDVAGTAEFGGCPPPVTEEKPEQKEMDRDQDGIPDRMDACPVVAGLEAYNGCPPPSSLPDQIQEAPKVQVPADVEDTLDRTSDNDGDGVPNYIDRCPNTKGPVSNDGCPVISADDRSVLDLAMRSVQFETGSATILPDSYRTLDRISEIMLKYGDYHLIINGHTDNVGRSQSNLLLSEQRAKACYNYLISRGVSARRMIHSGFGDAKPLTSNKSETGKSLNRRVEFIMYLK
ncbi:MAG: thrombospondin type 3 repeat-containing protein [Saprospiraceae bacterium]|nr:thrombospondin type 3 repeat-containing protein [Saprospiraceae bacterium]